MPLFSPQIREKVSNTSWPGTLRVSRFWLQRYLTLFMVNLNKIIALLAVAFESIYYNNAKYQYKYFSYILYSTKSIPIKKCSIGTMFAKKAILAD